MRNTKTDVRQLARDRLSRERGATIKDWGGRIPIAVVYPNSYYIGMSNLALQTVYAMLNAYPELVWLNRWHIVVPLALAIGCYAVGGLSGLAWGFCISTTLLWHSTYTINSLAHRWGSRRYETDDDSRNNLWLALLTLGEGWHNNHHHYMAAARQGFFWWEIDVTYYVLRAMQSVGLIWDVREPPAQVVRRGP